MARIRLSAILWRRMNRATFDTLAGNSAGQYDIRLGSDESIEEFLEGVDPQEHTELGGFTLAVPIEAFDGPNPIGPQTLHVRYMGRESARGDWNIPSQRPDTAYPLWRRGRGAPLQFQSSPHEFALLARDVHGHFHARWISEQNFNNLPPEIQTMLLQRDVGIAQL